MVRYPKSVTKQINVAFPIHTYERIIARCQELGGIAPSALVRAEFLRVTNNATQWNIDERYGLPMAKSFAVAAVTLDEAEMRDIEEQADMLRDQMAARLAAKALAAKREAAEAEERQFGGASVLGSEFDDALEEWVDPEPDLSKYTRSVT